MNHRVFIATLFAMCVTFGVLTAVVVNAPTPTHGSPATKQTVQPAAPPVHHATLASTNYTESSTVTATKPVSAGASASSWFGGCVTATVTYSRYHNYLIYHELIYRYKQTVYWCYTCCWKITSWTKHAWYDYQPPLSSTSIVYTAAWYPCCHTLVVRSDGTICQGFNGWICALNSHVYIEMVVNDNGTYSWKAGGNG